jgi:hypothetical protein
MATELASLSSSVVLDGHGAACRVEENWMGAAFCHEGFARAAPGAQRRATNCVGKLLLHNHLKAMTTMTEMAGAGSASFLLATPRRAICG